MLIVGVHIQFQEHDKQFLISFPCSSLLVFLLILRQTFNILIITNWTQRHFLFLTAHEIRTALAIHQSDATPVNPTPNLPNQPTHHSSLGNHLQAPIPRGLPSVLPNPAPHTSRAYGNVRGPRCFHLLFFSLISTTATPLLPCWNKPPKIPCCIWCFQLTIKNQVAGISCK